MGERSMIMRKIMRVVVKNNEFSRDQGKGLREEEGGGVQGEERGDTEGGKRRTKKETGDEDKQEEG